MKKTQFTDLRKNIRKTIVSFIAIVFFIALAVAIFTGPGWSVKALCDETERGYNENNLYDLVITTPLGYSNEYIDPIKNTPGVVDVECANIAFESFNHNNSKLQSKIITITDRLNTLFNIQGKLPDKPNEIAVLSTSAKTLDLKVGDVITFNKDKFPIDLYTGLIPEKFMTDSVKKLIDKAKNIELEDCIFLNGTQFTITAIVDSPEFIDTSTMSYGNSFVNGYKNDCIMFVDESAIWDEMVDFKTQIYVKADTGGISCFDSAYSEKIAGIKDELGRVNADISRKMSDKLFEKTDAELRDALKESGITSINIPYTILTRDQLTSYYAMNLLLSRIGMVRLFMSSLFVIVGLLVCYSALSRNTYDQMKQIGTKKALGFKKSEITGYYLMYSTLALVIGCVLGVILGWQLVSRIMTDKLGQSFIVVPQKLPVDAVDILIICGIETAVILGVTVLACRRILKRSATQLLSGKSDVVGKKRFFEKYRLWKKLPLISQVIINNTLNEKRRVAGTIIGILGSTALLVTAFTLNDNVLKSFDEQYTQYFHFDHLIYFDPNEKQAAESIKEVLDSENILHASIYYGNIYVSPKDAKPSVGTLFVPQSNEEFNRLVSIENALSKEKLDYENGIFINHGFASFNKLSEGSEIKMVTTDGKIQNVNITGAFKYYLATLQVIISPEKYLELYGKNVEPNCIMVETGQRNIKEITDKISGIKGYIKTDDYKKVTQGIFNAFSSLSTVMVEVYVALSVVMAALVLLNLLIMFVSEKKKEITVLRINGYSLHAAKRYIYNDTVFLAIIGIALGIVLGNAVGNLTIEAIEDQTITFMHGFDAKACLIGIIGTALLTFGASCIALRRIKKFRLTEY